MDTSQINGDPCCPHGSFWISVKVKTKLSTKTPLVNNVIMEEPPNVGHLYQTMWETYGKKWRCRTVLKIGSGQERRGSMFWVFALSTWVPALPFFKMCVFFKHICYGTSNIFSQTSKTPDKSHCRNLFNFLECQDGLGRIKQIYNMESRWYPHLKYSFMIAP